MYNCGEKMNKKIEEMIKLADAKSKTRDDFDEIIVKTVVEECCRIFNIWTFYDNTGEEINRDDDYDVFQVKQIKRTFGIE